MHLQDAKNKEILTGCQLKNVFYHSGIPDGRHRVEESTFRSGFRLRAAKAFSGGGIARVTRCCSPIPQNRQRRLASSDNKPRAGHVCIAFVYSGSSQSLPSHTPAESAGTLALCQCGKECRQK